MTQSSESDSTTMRHPGGEPVKLRLTASQVDVLYWHLIETIDDAEELYASVLDEVLDQLPEEEILTRPPSVETLIEWGAIEPREDNELPVTWRNDE